MDRTDGPPAKVILQDLCSKIDRNQQYRFNINRASVLDGAMCGFKRLSYDPNLLIHMEALVQSPIF